MIEEKLNMAETSENILSLATKVNQSNETTELPTDTTTVSEEIWTPDVIQRVVSLVIIMIMAFCGNMAIVIV